MGTFSDVTGLLIDGFLLNNEPLLSDAASEVSFLLLAGERIGGRADPATLEIDADMLLLLLCRAIIS